MDSTNNNIPNTPQNSNNIPDAPQMPYAPYMPYNPQPAIKKQPLEFLKRDYIFIILFAVSAVLLAFLGGGIGYTVSLSFLLAVMTAYLAKNGKFSFLSVSSIIITALAGLSFTLYTGEKANYLAQLLIIAGGVLYTVSLCGTGVDELKDYIKIFYAVVVSPLMNTGLITKSVFAGGKKKNALQILLAVLLAIPVLAVVISLLISSDAAFEGMMSYIAEKIGIQLLKLVLSIVAFIFIFTYAVSCKFRLFEKDSNSDNARVKQFVKQAFAITFLSLLAAVYLAYIVSQFAYIFNSFKGLLPENFTFAEYARRGFFETEAIAFINAVIAGFFTVFCVRNEKGKVGIATKLLILFIHIFTLFMLVTAALKMRMYINTYGLTALRLFTSVFMLATASFSVVLAIKLFAPKSKPVKYAVVFSLAVFTALSLAGIDRSVASYNVNAYLNGRLKAVDITTLSNLSSYSSLPYLVKLTGCDDEKVSAQAKEAISYMYNCYADLNPGSNTGPTIHSEKPKFLDFTVYKYLTYKTLEEAKIENLGDKKLQYYVPYGFKNLEDYYDSFEYNDSYNYDY